ncbi:MAG: FAD-binding oxidoreductase [Halocynthiibacter sp.]
MVLNAADDAFRSVLAGHLPDQVFRPLTAAYLEEPRRRFTGRGELLVAPHTAAQVGVILRLCSAHRVGVVPFGGGTGLVGGQVKPEGAAPLILSLERMKAIRAVGADENILVAEAGAVLADVRAAALEADRLFPLSLASEGSCQIGGNLATNAGGLNVLRYGNARDLCLGLEAVLPNGEIWHGLTRLRKDNTGYDLRNLLIGSEGTLGIITAATLKLFARPANVGCALMVVTDPKAALGLLARAHDIAGGGVSAYELIHRTGLDFLSETMPELRQPLAQKPEWMVLTELGLPAGQSADAALETLFEVGLNAGLVSDGLVAQSEDQRNAFWAVRENIPEANKRVGAVVSHDISLPLGSVAAFIEKGAQTVAALGPFRINCFGHLGDGNLHYNVYPPKGGRRQDYANQAAAIQRAVHDLVASFEGSFSAEHGVGRLKTADLVRYADPTRLAAMRSIKSALDPAGIMNPGAVFGLPE